MSAHKPIINRFFVDGDSLQKVRRIFEKPNEAAKTLLRNREKLRFSCNWAGQHLLTHDAHERDTTLHMMLAAMKYPDYPVAVGVIRAVEDDAVYDQAVQYHAVLQHLDHRHALVQRGGHHAVFREADLHVDGAGEEGALGTSLRSSRASAVRRASSTT